MLDYIKREIIACEAFIRRASKINLPFMLKGSYVTRQYFSNVNNRIPADLDWVYLNKINDEETAVVEIFGNWLTNITELELNDTVKFRSFKENEFWKRVDYAMADDFPTINTKLIYEFDRLEYLFRLDVSFNLDIEQPPISLTYQPLMGEPFIVPNTVPLSLQVAWKIHQTLVRPRFKDLFDLIHLVKHKSFDKNTLALSKQALINECKAGNVKLKKIEYFLNYEIDKLFRDNPIDVTWNYWRHKIRKEQESPYLNIVMSHVGNAEDITDVKKLPADLSVFLNQFREALEAKGWTMELINDLERLTYLKEINKYKS